jgi:8-oxo-dGTP pyrophosphatase MutT (NUDIX family)
MPMPGWLSKALLVDYRRFLPIRVQEKRFGWVRPEFAATLARFPDVFKVEPERVAVVDVLDTPQQRSDAVRRVLEILREEGLVAGWRNEDYEVFADASGEPLFRIERAAVKRFGIRGRATHVNGLVETPHGVQMWVARRAESKSTDPGKLDNLVGGGIAWGLDAWETLIKEAREEAGVPAFLAREAKPRDTLAFDYVVSDGLDANEVEAFDLFLPSIFRPRNEDGEVAGFELLPLDEVRSRLDVPNLFTVDAALVALRCLERHGVS